METNNNIQNKMNEITNLFEEIKEKTSKKKMAISFIEVLIATMTIFTTIIAIIPSSTALENGQLKAIIKTRELWLYLGVIVLIIVAVIITAHLLRKIKNQNLKTTLFKQHLIEIYKNSLDHTIINPGAKNNENDSRDK